jgi:hypothetical protein
MRDRFVYALAQCDVPPERHAALQSFRDKRRLWLSWLDAIWTTLHSMVWTDVAFKTLTDFAVGDDEDALNNPLIHRRCPERTRCHAGPGNTKTDGQGK